MTFSTRLYSSLFILMLMTASSFAQKIGMVKGSVADTAISKPLPGTTINVLDAKDSSLVTFGRSKEDGSFSVTKLANGSYVLILSYTGYTRVVKPFDISTDKPVVDFENIPMMSTASTLEDVTVTAAPVVIKGDTIEYNAGSFKVNKPNAVVEDLLKKLPGVEVEKDGTIKANGQEVKRVLVDGKQFFANDPKLATKNLQADMVNKVQVFDKKSDKSEFTGFDDGNSEPTINLTLKNDKRTGVFGKVAAGGGTDDRYKANANVNSFKKGEQLSFIGQANNVNQQGFSIMDALSFSGGPGSSGGMTMLSGGSGLNISGAGNSSQGITSTQAVGANYNNFKNNKIDFTSSYFFNGTQLDNDYLTHRQTLIGDSTQYYSEPGKNSRDNYNHRLNLGLDWKIDSNNSLKITPTFSYQQTYTSSQKTYNTLGPKGVILTDGLSRTNSSNEGYNFNTTALWRHRFAKKGRTFSAELKYGRNESDGDGDQYTVNNQFLNGNGHRYDTINQQNTTSALAESYSINIGYTEPVSKRSLVEWSAWYNHSGNESNRITFNYNKATGNYDLIDKRLTNFFDNDYDYSGTGLNYRENRKGWNYTIGAKLQHAELKSLLQGKSEPISQSFLNVLPNAQLQIGKNRYRNFRLFYNGSTQQPSVSQLQPVEDISDPLNIKVGNPDLKQSFSNNVRLNYNSFDPYTQKSFFLFLNGRQTFNAIVNSDSVGSFGGRKTTYANANGVYNVNANMAIGFPLKFGETKANMNLNTGTGYSRNINYLNDLENIINIFNVNEKVSVNYTFKELFDLGIGGGVTYNMARYSQQQMQNTNYFTYSGNADFNLYLPKGFTFMTDVDYTKYTGRTNGFNTTFTLWNASVAKTFLKNKKGEIRLSVNDILNQNTGITRNTNSSYVEDIQYTVLKRYFMLTFTYSLSKFGMIGEGRGGSRIMMMGGPR